MRFWPIYRLRVLLIRYEIEAYSTSDDDLDFVLNTEGRLEIISSDGICIFGQEYLLLVELAVYAKRWMNQSSATDFYYESMDYEEHPLIAFELQEDIYEFRSIWQRGACTNITKAEIHSCFGAFIIRLKKELRKKGIRIPAELKL